MPERNSIGIKVIDKISFAKCLSPIELYKNSHLHLLVSLKSYHGPILSLAKLKSWYELSNCELIWRIKCFRNLHRDRLEEQVPNRTLNLNFKGFEHFTYLERQRRIQ